MAEQLDFLPMFPMKQAAIIGHMLNNPSFFIGAIGKIQPNWFRDIYHQKLFNNLVKLHTQIKRVPSVDEFKNFGEFTKEDLGIRNKLFNELGNCLEASVRIGLDTIKPELTSWLHSKILQEAMVKGSKNWNQGKYSDSALLLEQAVKAYHEAKFEEGETVDFLNFTQYLRDTQIDRDNALTTGLTVLDNALLEGATKGGLQLGDTTVLLAPTNVGKTTTMITMAVHNILQGKNVFFMTHEGVPSDIRMKFLKCILGVNTNELFKMYNTPEGMKALEMASKQLNKRLRYIPYNKAGMTIEDVLPIIRREIDKFKAEHDGDGFSLLVSDYPAKLWTSMAAKGNMPHRICVEYVYNIYIQLALEYKMHSLLAYQTNREASKENHGKYSDDAGENRLIGVDDAGEAFGPMKDATNVITLNRSPRAELLNQMTFFISKSRSNKTGVAVVAKTNFGAAQTHSNELGAISYVGTRTKDNSIEQILQEHKNEAVPLDLIEQEN
jgi:replicative DNA helicase